jgi:predicted alpha-1,6-mannanase (GH76 family)
MKVTCYVKLNIFFWRLAPIVQIMVDANQKEQRRIPREPIEKQVTAYYILRRTKEEIKKGEMYVLFIHMYFH